ncbi:retrovirus-related pol polyprotein from transposon TNT 1-94 [Tanacetum coccineum]
MAVHTLNLLPTTTLSYRVPFEVLYGFFPSYTHLRVFGCLCYPNLSAITPHRLAPRSTACVFLGPSSDHRGYRCFDLITQRVIISRHINFDEDHFPYSLFHLSPLQKDYDVFTSIDDDLPSLLCPTNVATPPAPTPPLSTSHHEELIASSSSASSEAPSLDSITTSIVDPMVVAHIQAGPTSTYPMTTWSKMGSLKQCQIFNQSATTRPSPILISTAQALIAASWSHVGMFLSQKMFSRDILSRADMDNCNPYSTPVDTKSKLSSVGTPGTISSDDDRDLTNSPQITKPELKIGDEFLKILHDNSFNGMDESDVIDHIKSLSGDAEKWCNNEGTTTTWKELGDKFFHKYYPLSHTCNSNRKDYFEFLYCLASKFDNYWEIDKNTKNGLWEFYVNERTKGTIDDLDEYNEPCKKTCSDLFFKPYLDAQDGKDIYEIIDRDYSPIPTPAHRDISNPDELCKTEEFTVVRYSMGSCEEFITVGPSKISTDAIQRILGFGMRHIDLLYRPCCKEIDDMVYSEKDVY